MKNKGFLQIILVILLALIVAAATRTLLERPATTSLYNNSSYNPNPITNILPNPPYNNPNPINQNTPPSPNGTRVILRVGEREGSFEVKKINQTTVDGLWYQSYPVAMMSGQPKTINVGDDIGYACEGVSEKLIKIDFVNQTITFNKVTSKPPYGGCPI